MDFEFLIYDKFPVIRQGLGIIVSKSNPNTTITYSKSLDDFIIQLKESKINLILADITSEKIDFFELIDLLLPSLSSEKKLIVFTEKSNGLFKERCSFISPYIFFLDKNSSENVICKKIDECIF